MLEIEFRGKSIKSSKWIYGSLFINKQIISYQIIDRTLYGKEVIPETIGQYTGLKDKNGTKIFEGDIVKIHGHSFDFGFEKDKIGQIKFINGAFGFYISQTENEYIFNELSVEFSYGELNYYEVIGNISDNPELLKEKL